MSTVSSSRLSLQLLRKAAYDLAVRRVDYWYQPVLTAEVLLHIFTVDIGYLILSYCLKLHVMWLLQNLKFQQCVKNMEHLYCRYKHYRSTEVMYCMSRIVKFDHTFCMLFYYRRKPGKNLCLVSNCRVKYAFSHDVHCFLLLPNCVPIPHAHICLQIWARFTNVQILDDHISER